MSWDRKKCSSVHGCMACSTPSNKGVAFFTHSNIASNCPGLFRTVLEFLILSCVLMHISFVLEVWARPCLVVVYMPVFSGMEFNSSVSDAV